MPRYKLIASDLDGTLLNDELKMSEENRRAIRGLTERGVYFVPATGRTFTEIEPSVLSLPEVRYILCSNGTILHDKLTGKRITTCFTKEESNKIIDLFCQYKTAILLHYDGGSYADADKFTAEYMAECQLSPVFSQFILDMSTPIECFNDWQRTLAGIEAWTVFFDTDDALFECRTRLEALGYCTVVSSAPHNIEVFHKNAGKGNSLLKLAEHLGIKREEVIAVGDTTNDSSMISAAGLGLAMENAVPELKAISDGVICNNEEHAIKYILEHYII